MAVPSRQTAVRPESLRRRQVPTLAPLTQLHTNPSTSGLSPSRLGTCLLKGSVQALTCSPQDRGLFWNLDLSGYSEAEQSAR